MIHAIKAKALVCAGLIHVGLLLALIALFRDGGNFLSGVSFGLMLAGVALMYIAFMYAALSVWIPLRPWMERYHRAKSWRRWALEELPTILALIPVLMAALRVLKTSWNEIKAFQESGELSVQNLAKVAQKFAAEAESLSKDPAAQALKDSLND